MSLILTQLLNVAYLVPLQVVGGAVLHSKQNVCRTTYDCFSCTGLRFPLSLLQFFFIHEGCLYACFFYLAYRSFHGKRKNSILCVVNIITGPTKSFDWGIVGCLLLEASSKLLSFSVNMLFQFLIPPLLRKL